MLNLFQYLRLWIVVMNPMLNKLKITYLFESTTLWGGNKVGFEQAEALSEAGHDVTILSKDAGPTWYNLRLPVMEVPNFDATTIPESDIIIGTFWPTVKAAYESGKGIPVHLCQGYEGGCKEYNSIKAAIDEVYSYKIPRLTVSPHLDKLLIDQFNAETHYIGQMLNRDIFYPLSNSNNIKRLNPFKLFRPKALRILVIGPFEADVKNIPTTLKGISLAKERHKLPVKLIRVSQFPLSAEEKKIMKPDLYHFHTPYHEMGEIYRNADVLISMSKEAEGFGLPPLEAMACGVPTILSRIPSHLAYDDINDYAVFTEMNPEAVSNAIQILYKNKELRQRLSARGLSVAAKFTKKSVLSRLTAAFKDIISSSKITGDLNKNCLR